MHLPLYRAGAEGNGKHYPHSDVLPYWINLPKHCLGDFHNNLWDGL